MGGREMRGEGERPSHWCLSCDTGWVAQRAAVATASQHPGCLWCTQLSQVGTTGPPACLAAWATSSRRLTPVKEAT